MYHTKAYWQARRPPRGQNNPWKYICSGLPTNDSFRFSSVEFITHILCIFKNLFDVQLLYSWCTLHLLYNISVNKRIVLRTRSKLNQGSKKTAAIMVGWRSQEHPKLPRACTQDTGPSVKMTDNHVFITNDASLYQIQSYRTLAEKERWPTNHKGSRLSRTTTLVIPFHTGDRTQAASPNFAGPCSHSEEGRCAK